ncbi:isoaspartyl peptidase/L-asparaginase family protein [Parapedobacter deserti]|uniref:Isoaspartyl peptidase/L-asparaginase family protein n=1 Tax=Parapedobacter deserti TaxID=1912957 RepID=A0ABV7JP47_9SPHI
MKKTNLRNLAAVMVATVGIACTATPTAQEDRYVLVIHGGAGTIQKSDMTPEREQAYRATLEEALRTGHKLLQQGSSSLDAVEATIHVLEDSPLFNAGKGAVFTHDGHNELDASIMDGHSGQAGAIAGVRTVRHPISAARAVMEKTEHVLLSGAGADRFAAENGLEIVEPSYFHTPERWQSLQEVLKQDSLKATGNDSKFGTVGCVALDQKGRLAAGTSTGGMTNKRYGRVGDSPIIGAGTYANESVGVSCTGWGEFYIRHVVAHDVAALMAYKGLGVAEATEAVIAKVDKAGGDGGIIALDREGRMSMSFNTAGMYRGAITSSGEVIVGIYQ